MSAVEGRKPSNIDDTILKYADSMSPDEISMSLGGVISPAAVAARTQSLLKAKDWLTEAQEDQLVTLRMKELVYGITSNDYKYLDVKLRALIALGDRLDKRKKATEVDLNMLYGNQGALLGRVVDMALSYMRGALREEVDGARWDDLVAEAVTVAQAEIAKHEAVEA